ncbi:MAG: PorT family protein [candidate division Zixibacteria bacterium]|nr:PorT family protein [candidate division Zixibacteria bacterium]
MKTFAILLVALLALALTAVAQDQVTGITAKGFKAGLNLANHHGSDKDDNHSTRTGFAFGAFMTYAFSPQFAVQPEVLYTQKGYEWDDGVWTETGKFDYIEIPVLVKFNIPMDGHLEPTFYAGPAVGILMNAKVDWETEGESGTEDVKDSTKSIDFGVAFGGGFNMAMGAQTLTFDVRYILGLAKIDDRTDPADVKNAVFEFMLGFGF